MMPIKLKKKRTEIIPAYSKLKIMMTEEQNKLIRGSIENTSDDNKDIMNDRK